MSKQLGGEPSYYCRQDGGRDLEATPAAAVAEAAAPRVSMLTAVGDLLVPKKQLPSLQPYC